MDKNKNRTDLLAAGRKKLQQYRQKKDGKGSKSSNKANKHDTNVVTGDSSSVTKPPPVQASDTELVELSSQASTDTPVATNADVATPDLSSTSNVPIEGSKVVDDSVPNEDVYQSSNVDDVIPIVSPPRKVVTEGEHESGFSVGLKAVLDDRFARGEDQVPDVGTLQEDNRTSLIDVEGGRNEVNLGNVEEDAKMESPNTGIEETSEEHGGISAFANVDVNSASGFPPSFDHESGIGDSGDTNADVHSASGIPSSSDLEPLVGDSGDADADADVSSASGLLPSSDHESGIGVTGDTNVDENVASGLSSSDHEPAIGDSGDMNAGVHSASELPSSSIHEATDGDSSNANADVHTASGLPSSDHEPGIGDSSGKNADVISDSGPPPSSDREPTVGDSGDTNADVHSLSGLLYSDPEPRIGDSGDTNVDVHSASGLPSSDHELAVGDSGDTNADKHSLSGLLYSDPEPAIADSGDTNVDGHSLSRLMYSDPEPRIGDSVATNADENSLSGLLYSDHEPVLRDFGDTNADEQSIPVVPLDHEPRIGDSGVPNADKHSLSGLLYSDHETGITDSGDTDADAVVDINMKSGPTEFPEKLKEQLYIENFEKELVYTQLFEERNARKRFEQQRLEWANEKSSFTASIGDLEDKNKTLSEELSKCRSELERFANKMEEVEMSVSFSKTELDWSSSRIQELQNELSNVSSELVDSNSLVQDLQLKNETLEVNVGSLTQEKEGLVLENEKLIKELMECKSLIELSQGENVKVKESLGLVMEERAKLEEIRQNYESEKEKLLIDWKKLEEVLASEREERSKNNEANEHFIQENNKVSMELLESKKLMESLQLEIANLNENLDVVTKERSKLGEDMDHIRLEKEECLKELTNCKTLLENLQVEYEKSMNESRDSALKLEKLTDENVTLTSTLNMYKDKITELDELKIKSDQTEAMKEQSNGFEETFLKNVILDEVMKQYVSMVEAKKGELVILCEDLRQETVITKMKNSQLTEELHNSESRIQDFQEQLHNSESRIQDFQQKLHNSESRIQDFQEKLHNSESRIQDFQEKLYNSESRIQDFQEKLHNSESRIQDLQEKLEDARGAHNLVSDSYKDMTEKLKDLESTNELAAYVIHKVFDNLQKIVNNSTEESEDDTKGGQLDHLEISNYDVFIDRLIMIIRERAQLETKNREYNLDLLRRIKELEESNRMFNNPAKDLKLIELHNQINDLTSSIVSHEIESRIFKESLRSSIEQIVVIQSETKIKETELHQSENRVSVLREKLHIAVTKGKGLIQQRDSLKQNLSVKDAAIQELETKLKSYSEAGERMEALESELSYIRNSATALRESFLLKDSVLQRIEEILEDLDLPEHFHDRDIIEKIDWLAKSVSHGPSQTGVIERARSYPGSIDGWKEDLEPVSDEFRRNYEELQNKFYELAEQNEMLEQSLMERNNLVQRCEEVLEKTNMPLQLRSMEPEDKIDWLRVALAEANDRCALLEQSLTERNNVVQRCEEVLEKTNMPLNLPSLEHKIEWLHAAHSKANDLSAILQERHNQMQRCEEVLEKTDMPSHLRSLEPEDKIDWLRGSLSEANDRFALVQQDLEKVRESLSGDLEESNRRLLDLEANIKSITDEKEQILARFEAQSQDYNKIFEKVGLYEIENAKLENEIGALQSKLDEKRVDEDHIKRLQDLVKNMLQETETEDLDSSMNDIEYLEGLLIKLEEKYPKYPSGERSIEELEVLERKVEEIEGDLVQVKEERDIHMEKSQSLVNQVEELESKIQELQKLLAQEEQKTGVVREKLNVAVRKGKSLVQQRDAMKQTINELTTEVDRLTSEVKVRENTLLGHQEKMKELFTLQELVENKDSEIGFLKNRLEEIFGALREVNVGVDLKTSDPIEKIEQIEKKCRDLQDGIMSAEQDSRKSKRAAELLLEELNEVQERNEDLLEEISKISKEKDSAEIAMRDSMSHLEQLSAVHMEERSSQFEELMMLKSGFEELKPELRKIYNLVNDVLPQDLDYLYNLESSVKSLLESSDDLKSSHGGITSRKDSKENLHSRFFIDTKREEEHSDNEIIDLWKFIGTHMQDLMTNITVLEEKLQNHSKSLNKESTILSETISTLHTQITQTHKQKETENSTLRKNISMLYEACKNSVYEIQKSKGELISNDDLESSLFIEGEPLSVSEERIVSIVNRLLSHVKEFHNFQTENVEVKLKEMKDTISSLQKELTEKDVQKDRMCVDLVSQIKRAETTAMNNLQELESSKALINDLKGQLEGVNLECDALKQRVKEVEEGQESVLVDLQEKVKSLKHALTAKEQEAEALLQALDEEEAQMEELTNKNTELQKQIQQKTLDLETTEAARGKSLKKLSITVNKFDELHHLSETLVSEIDNLQSQIQERDSEISFLRDEITRCTSDSLQALESDKKGVNGIQDILSWLQTQDLNLDDNDSDQVHEYKDLLKGKITSIVSELKELRQVAQSKDELLLIERSKVEDLNRRREILESSLREQETRLSLHQDDAESSEIVEVEPVINKWQPKGTTMAPQVRSLRKVNNDQLAISIDDMDSDEKDKLEDEDDDKAHGFKSLTTSKLVPKFTRPVTNFVDGLWVSCDRALQRQPVLRLSLILYWALMHALLATFVV